MRITRLHATLLLTAVLLTRSSTLAAQAPAPKSIPADQLSDIATILAHDEGWPLGNPDYTLDPMTPAEDDGFDSIGLYKKGHLVRMYSINRATGQIVDFIADARSSASLISRTSNKAFAPAPAPTPLPSPTRNSPLKSDAPN